MEANFFISGLNALQCPHQSAQKTRRIGSSFLVLKSSLSREHNDIPIDVIRDKCWHLYQSKMAISSGGLFGLGPGTSRARWGSLPNSWSDFIASIVGEEYGFVGFIVLIVALFLLIISFYGLALTTISEFNRLYFVGIGSWILIQTLFNLGGLLGLLPITGIVLPFVAYGGSAMVSIFIALTIANSKEEIEVK